MQNHAESAFHHSAGVISDDWVSDSNISGRSTSSFVLPPASTAKERGIPDFSLILNKSRSGTRSLARSAVVEGSSRQVEWKGSTSPGSGYIHGNGCLPAGMGSMMWRFAIRRAVDQQGAVHAHKLSGTLGGSVCSETSPKQSQNLHIGMQMDNTTAVAYVNRMGGTHSNTLSNMAYSSGSGTFRGASHCLQSTSQEFTTKQQMPNPKPFTPQPNDNCFLRYSGG